MKKLFLQIAQKLKDNRAISVFIEILIACVIAFVIGGIILELAGVEFKVNIIPNVLKKITELLSW